MQHSIHWPEGYIPGEADNFASNEVIVAGLNVAQVWPLLNTPALWPGYYSNCADITFAQGAGPQLAQGARFSFSTFGFPVQAQVVEYVAPVASQPGRVAWHGWVEGDASTRLDVHHAWLLEDLPGGRVRILTQETQNGAPAKALAQVRPNPMINGHQDWLDGLVSEARRQLP
ncbi:SRPBCC domain-containing protein [Pseudomonas sp. 3A(2025)]